MRAGHLTADTDGDGIPDRGLYFPTVIVTAGGKNTWERFQIEVREANRDPQMEDLPDPQTITAGLVYGYDVQVTDPDFDPLT